MPIISEQIYDSNKKKECVLTINIIGSGRVGAAGKAHQHQGGGALVHAVLVVLVRGASVAAAWTPFAWPATKNRASVRKKHPRYTVLLRMLYCQKDFVFHFEYILNPKDALLGVHCMNSKDAKRFPRPVQCIFCANKSSCWDDELVLASLFQHLYWPKTHPGAVRMITVYFFLSLPLFWESTRKQFPKEIVLPESANWWFFF